MPTAYYPVYLDLKGQRCVVIGGGEVAERKVEGLLASGAQTEVISPQVTSGLEERASQSLVTWHRRKFAPGDLAGAALVIAATDDQQVNRAVFEEAREVKALVNVVDQPGLCTFIAPSVVRRGDVTLAISTGGLSPALSRKLRQELEASQALDYADMAGLVSKVRSELRRRGISPSPTLWQASLNGEVLRLYREGRYHDARERLLAALSSNPTSSEKGANDAGN